MRWYDAVVAWCLIVEEGIDSSVLCNYNSWLIYSRTFFRPFRTGLHSIAFVMDTHTVLRQTYVHSFRMLQWSAPKGYCHSAESFSIFITIWIRSDKGHAAALELPLPEKPKASEKGGRSVSSDWMIFAKSYDSAADSGTSGLRGQLRFTPRSYGRKYHIFCHDLFRWTPLDRHWS